MTSSHDRKLQSLLPITAACLAAVLAIGLIAAVTTLFQSRGTPFAELASAERACSAHAYVSEREACMREWIASAPTTRIAAQRAATTVAEDLNTPALSAARGRSQERR